MDDDKKIYVPGLGDILFADRKTSSYFRRTTVLYGLSGTGKTTLIYWILKILKPLIPNVIVISPTEDGNSAWKDRVPPRCIKKRVDVQDLRDLLTRQKNAVLIYNKANRLNILEQLVRRTGDRETQRLVIRIRELGRQNIDSIQKSTSLNYAEREELINDVQEKCRLKIVDIYKDVIIKHKEFLKKQPLSDDEKYSLHYLNFNPALLLIMDDCASQIAEWGKDPSISELFYEGRHWWITSMYTMQNDKSLHPGPRKNAFNSFFTDPASATCFFSSTANGITPALKKRAMALIDYIFKPNATGTQNFKKLVYSRLDPVAPTRYILAETYPVFRIGCEALWTLCEKVPSDEKKTGLNKDDKFYASFTPDF